MRSFINGVKYSDRDLSEPENVKVNERQFRLFKDGYWEIGYFKSIESTREKIKKNIIMFISESYLYLFIKIGKLPF